MRRLLLLADVCGLCVAFVATQLLVGSFSEPHRLAPVAELALFTLTIPVWIVLAKLYGLYDRDEERPAHTTVDDLQGVLHMVTLGVWLVAVAAWLTGVVKPEFARFVVFWVVAIAVIVLARSLARKLARRTTTYVQRALIVGTDGVAQLIAEKLRQRPERGIEVLGFVCESPESPGARDVRPRLLGRTSEARSIVSRLGVDRVIIARLALEKRDQRELVRGLREEDVQIDVVLQPFEAMGPGGSVHTLDGIAMVGLSSIQLSQSSLLLKRAMDIVLSSLGLVLVAPIFAFIALRIKLDSAGPVFYRHERIGQDGRRFRLLKFRTMRARYCRGSDYGAESAEREFARLMEDPSLRADFERDYKLRDDPRVTKFGAFLRRASLDEVPQLVNVLRGELSLVGPRPIVPQELERYGEEAQTLLSLRPGVTGYWQVNGRSDSGYSERVRLDIAYASNWSIQLDLAILAHTARLLVSRPRGAY